MWCYLLLVFQCMFRTCTVLRLVNADIVFSSLLSRDANRRVNCKRLHCPWFVDPCSLCPLNIISVVSSVCSYACTVTIASCWQADQAHGKLQGGVNGFVRNKSKRVCQAKLGSQGLLVVTSGSSEAFKFDRGKAFYFVQRLKRSTNSWGVGSIAGSADAAKQRCSSSREELAQLRQSLEVAADERKVYMYIYICYRTAETPLPPMVMVPLPPCCVVVWWLSITNAL